MLYFSSLYFYRGTSWISACSVFYWLALFLILSLHRFLQTWRGDMSRNSRVTFSASTLLDVSFSCGIKDSSVKTARVFHRQLVSLILERRVGFLTQARTSAPAADCW